ncbi:MAG: hypothetical protein HOC27_00885 [Phycisphaerae bacterium]|jgi:hypothetical protein|nr:hypothetical protein [Phycisphaerae bacterium]
MTEEKITVTKQCTVIGWIGAILVRLIVPGWVFYGALTKTLSAAPDSLPPIMYKAGDFIGFSDRFTLLAVLVSIEYFFVGLMLFGPKVARRAAIVILSIFIAVLSIEMFVFGHYDSCGCFGEDSLSPVTMFSIDLALLIGIALCKPRASQCGLNKGNRSAICMSIFFVVALIFTYTMVMSKKPINSNNSTLLVGEYWYPEDIGDWIGKDIRDLELFSSVQEWPRNIRDGKQYVIFYSLTCDHCEALLYAHFEFPQTPTTLVAIPETTEGFDEDNAFNNPCVDCSKTKLLVGPNWTIGTPLVVAIEDGIVKCANENEDYEAPACLIW